MMRVLADIAFSLFALGYLPIFLAKLRQAEDPKRLWRERLGELPASLAKTDKPRIWLHAVSVGEVRAVEIFYKLLVKQGFDVVLSTVTPTGQKEAVKLAGANTIYFPFDLSFAVEKSLDALRPDLVILAETELWPNFILAAKKRGIPVGIVNGRLSARSYQRYLWIDSLIRPVLEALSFLYVQTPKDAERFELLGAPRTKVEVLGNMKFDAKTPEKVSPAGVRAELKLSAGRKVWVAGSTHPGEERKVLAVYTRLRSLFPDLALIIAPRHIERSDETVSLVREFNYRPLKFSELAKEKKPYDALIVDTIGELRRIYAAADAVFLGGSLIPHGGQNPIEPAVLERPILSGPNVFNFEYVYQELSKAGGVSMVVTEDEMFVKLKEIFEYPSRFLASAQAAARTVERLAGASRRTADKVKALLKPRASRKDPAQPELLQAT